MDSDFGAFGYVKYDSETRKNPRSLDVPLVSGNELIFVDSFLYLWGFHKFDENGKLIFVEDSDDEDDRYEKSMLFTSERRAEDEDYTRYELFDLSQTYDLETLPYR